VWYISWMCEVDVFGRCIVCDVLGATILVTTFDCLVELSIIEGRVTDSIHVCYEKLHVRIPDITRK
jgi:hypothetical protein